MLKRFTKGYSDRNDRNDLSALVKFNAENSVDIRC